MPRFPSFRFCPITQNRKLGNLGKCCFTSNFDISCNLRCKNDKNELRQKLKGQDMSLEEKKKKLPRFPSFRFCPITTIENLEISESFFGSLGFKCTSEAGNNYHFPYPLSPSMFILSPHRTSCPASTTNVPPSLSARGAK